MILRICAMYNRSRRILAILLVIYIPTLVLSITSAAYSTGQKLYLSGNVQVNRRLPAHSTSLSAPTLPSVLAVADVKICVMATNDMAHVVTYAIVARLVIGTLLCILAVAKFVRQSLEIHKALKQWRSDRYMKLFVRESILYFIAYALRFFRYSNSDPIFPYQQRHPQCSDLPIKPRDAVYRPEYYLLCLSICPWGPVRS
jgi:hypothetical protein